MSAFPLTSIRDASSMQRVGKSFSEFLDRYRSRLTQLFESRTTADRLNLNRGLPPFAMNLVREVDPLSVYIPTEYGGRGNNISECLSILEATGYESLPLCLTIGINGGLFLQPLGKYGNESIKRPIFEQFTRNKKMGGLMITEPDHGSDALSMQTAYTATGNDSYHIEGTKHWAGLTGWADYWLLTARARATDGNLRRDIDFFVCDVNAPGQHIEVEEVYRNLGLRMIPYGRNKIDVEVPGVARLEPKSTGIKLMLDLLHRSRLQFPGMGMGFLRRMLDEAVEHCRERFVGGSPLFDYDQVRARLARLQASVTACAAMCLHSSEHAGVDEDLANEGLKANAMKTVVTDLMHEASQSLQQLLGAKGYKEDNIAGRSTNDSRPFQIFEGSNDILYQQISESVLKSMRKMKENNLYQYLKQDDSTTRAADYFRDVLSFDVDWALPQRKLVELGKALGRIMSMEMTIEMGERGYQADLIANALESFRTEVNGIMETYRTGGLTAVIEDYRDSSGWLQFVESATVRTVG